MNLSLNRHIQELIAKRVQSGQYASPEDVVEAALGALESNEKYGDFAPGELDKLIEEGRSSEPLLDGETFLKELRELRKSLLLRTKR